LNLTTSSFTLLTVKSSPAFVQELASDAVTVCDAEAVGSMTPATTTGTVTVLDAGADGASANVVAVPSMLTTSALPIDPVHVAGVCSVTAPTTRSSSPEACDQEPLFSGTLVDAPCGAATEPLLCART
jgi:hypothetical protein